MVHMIIGHLTMSLSYPNQMNDMLSCMMTRLASKSLESEKSQILQCIHAQFSTRYSFLKTLELRQSVLHAPISFELLRPLVLVFNHPSLEMRKWSFLIFYQALLLDTKELQYFLFYFKFF